MPTKKVTKRKKAVASKQKSLFRSLSSSKLRVLLVVLVFGLVGTGYLLYQTFAATNTVKYFGVLDSKNPSATYKVTTGAGKMNVLFSNNTRELTLNINNSAGKLIGSIKSAGAKDVALALTVVPDTYTFSLKIPNTSSRNLKHGYKIEVAYPTGDTVIPTAVITKPFSSETVAGTVDFSANAQDDVAVTKVEFYVAGSLLGTDSSAPYSVKWDTTSQADGARGLSVKSYDGSGNVGVASGEVTVKNTTITTQSMSMCVSDSSNDHGGTEDWDAWRVYREGSMLEKANRTGNLRPKALAYSEDGPNLGGANPNYNSVYNHVLGKLNSFYYTSASSQTKSARWGIQLFWSNGNENHDKGAISLPHTSAKIAAYTTSQRALYDAVHYVDPDSGGRRFPDAYAGSNPTHNGEQQGHVEAWLHASARYHDFVMWSMYPPGRQTTSADPTFNWPTFDESKRTSKEGFLIRTFYRTKQAEAQAGHPLMISVGELGIGNDPDDGTTRPYYAVHGLAHSLVRLSDQYDLEIPFACWWDQQKDEAGAPENILSDEQSGLNPTTRQAWQNWKQYDHLSGGTHPSSWPTAPRSGWKTSGTFPTQ